MFLTWGSSVCLPAMHFVCHDRQHGSSYRNEMLTGLAQVNIVKSFWYDHRSVEERYINDINGPTHTHILLLDVLEMAKVWKHVIIWPNFVSVPNRLLSTEYCLVFLYCVSNWFLSRPFDLILSMCTQLTPFKTIWPNFIYVESIGYKLIKLGTQCKNQVIWS